MAQNVSKVPKGGSKINIRTDKIMGNQPISSLPGMAPIILFLQSKGIHILDQISQWDTNTQAWKRSSLPPIPKHLKENLNNFRYIFTTLLLQLKMATMDSDGIPLAPVTQYKQVIIIYVTGTTWLQHGYIGKQCGNLKPSLR